MSTYSNYGCRCDECRAAHAAAQALYDADRASALEYDPTIAVHGSRSTYSNYGCRCDECRVAKAVANREYRARRKARRVA